MRICVIDDDIEILKNIKVVLEMEDYEVDAFVSAKEGLSACMTGDYDLLLTDLHMEEINGFTIVDLLLDLKSDLKIILFTGDYSIENEVKALEKQVVDYLTKPVDPRVLLLRISKALEKRDDKSFNERIIESNSCDLKLNVDSREVHVSNKKINLTNIEYRILLLFLRNKREVLSRQFIYSSVWNDSEIDATELRVIDTHIQRLRTKLVSHRIFSERGVGYVWQEGA